MNKQKAAAPSAARLEPAGHPANAPSEQPSPRQPPPGAIALRLAAIVGKAPKDWIYVASSERRVEEIARALAGMATGKEVLHLPGWDCLPFDRAAPSPEIMGKRMRVLRDCKRSSKQSRMLVLSAEALIQKLPPPAAVDEVLKLRVGEPLDREEFERFALRTGYSFDDRVDEPGEIAMRGNVVEVFAAHLDEPIRLGRGRTQGIAYLFTDPEEELSDATRSRLSTLEAFDRLGSGFEISSRDLELRGAGELLGEEQAGHLHLIGAGLYQRLLERALAAAKGESIEAIAPAQLNVGLIGHIPSNYVPEATVRINLYARLQRIAKVEDLEAFTEELEDRFGPTPDEVDALLLATHVALAAGSRGVARVDAGPLGIALTFRTELDRDELTAKLSGKLHISGTRLSLERREGMTALDELAELLSLRSVG